MQIYLVGGAVRDRLLGLAVKDRDYVVVGATAEEMLAAGFKQVGRDFPVFLHPESGEEYALARTERKTAAGHRGFAFDFSPDVSLEEDLLRRDLTINAIAESADRTLIDPYGGCGDLKARQLRHVSPAFSEDPLRVLRLMRFYARFAPLGFSIAPETLALARQMAADGELATLTVERVWQEMEKALTAPAPEKFFQGLAEIGALAAIGCARLQQEPQVLSAQNRRLQHAAAHTDDPAARLARWTQGNAALIADLERFLPLPNRYRKLLHLFHDDGDDWLRWQALDGERRQSLLQHAQGLRKAGEVPILLQTLALPAAECERISALQRAVWALCGEELLAQGFHGAALGKEMRRRQVEILRPQR